MLTSEKRQRKKLHREDMTSAATGRDLCRLPLIPHLMRDLLLPPTHPYSLTGETIKTIKLEIPHQVRDEGGGCGMRGGIHIRYSMRR